METNQTKRSMKETAPGKCLRGINITINKFFSLKGLAEKVKEAGQVSQGPGASSRLSHQVGGVQEHCESAKGEQSLLHSYAPRRSWLGGKPYLYPPGGWLLGRVFCP